ncbi:adenylate cyclase type 10-like [Xylocopa sonorina]|uniref:adenylate cyclase type 10-like n=1 Tax=Xylocopa sonorina TaxID=1818115 RepID=UPI00403B30FB
MIVSSGEVTFSVIGDDRARQFVIAGTPIEDLKYARRICLPGDLVLSSSAWAHCAPSLYEYVIKDSTNVKIIKVIGPPAESELRRSTASFDESSIDRRQSVGYTESELSLLSDISVDSDVNLIQFQTRISVIDALRRGIGEHLKTYMLRPVLTQIDRDDPVKYLTEVRQITVICISVIPFECTVHELISLVDELFKIIQNIIEANAGCINMVNLFEKDVSFYILYGIRDYGNREDEKNSSKNGLLSAFEIMKETKRVPGVKTVLIGVSTGIAFCGIIGHVVRMQYMVFGAPINKAISMTMISYDKVSRY